MEYTQITGDHSMKKKNTTSVPSYTADQVASAPWASVFEYTMHQHTTGGHYVVMPDGTVQMQPSSSWAGKGK